MKRLIPILILMGLVVGCAAKEEKPVFYSDQSSSNEVVGEILLFTGEAAINYFLWDSGNHDLEGTPPPDWFKRD